MPQNPIQSKPGMSLSEFINCYGTEAHCGARLERPRGPAGFVCPECGEHAVRDTVSCLEAPPEQVVSGHLPRHTEQEQHLRPPRSSATSASPRPPPGGTSTSCSRPCASANRAACSTAWSSPTIRCLAVCTAARPDAGRRTGLPSCRRPRSTAPAICNTCATTRSTTAPAKRWPPGQRHIRDYRPSRPLSEAGNEGPADLSCLSKTY